MPDVLTAIRAKYPQYADVPDEQLGPAIVAKYPQYLERDPSLQRFSPVAARAGAPAPNAEPTPAPPSPAATGTLSDAAGFLDAFARGAKRLQQSVSLSETGSSAPSMRQERQGFERAMQDPRYFEQAQAAALPWQMDPLTGQPRNRARLARIEGTVGPAGQTEQAGRAKMSRREVAAADVSATEEELRTAPKSAGMEELAKAATTGEKWAAWRKNPVEITSQIVAESLVRSAPGIAAMAVAGPAGVGAGSFANELSAGVLESAQDQGFDIADPKQLQAFLDSPSARAEAQGYALKRAQIIGTLDAATAGAAGQILARTLGKGVARVSGGVAGEAAMQAAGGSGGEALAQTATGKPLDSFEIAMEGIAEIASAPAEVVSNLRQERARQSSTLSSQPSAQAPSSEPAQTQGEAGMVGGGATPIQSFPEPAATPAPTSLPPGAPDWAAEIAAVEALLAEREAAAPASPAPGVVGDDTTKPPQTITGSNVEMATDLPRRSQSAEAGMPVPPAAPDAAGGAVSRWPIGEGHIEVQQGERYRKGDEVPDGWGGWEPIHQRLEGSVNDGSMRVRRNPAVSGKAAKRMEDYLASRTIPPHSRRPKEEWERRYFKAGPQTNAPQQAAGLAAAPDEGTPQQSGPTPPTQAAPDRVADSPKPAKGAVAKAVEEVKEAYFDATVQGIAYDPQRDAAQMFRLYTALARLAKVLAREGVKTAAEFAARIGRKLDAMVQKAWDDAQSGNVARSIDELTDDVKQAAVASASERQFSARMAADERLDPAFREATGNRTYQPIPNLQTYSEALAVVQERGLDGALLALKDENNGLEPRVRVLLGQAIITRSNHEFAQSKSEPALDRGVEAAEWLTEFGTRLGQGVQAFAVWSRLTPEGIGRAYVRGIQRLNDKVTRGMTPIQKAKAELKLPKVDKDIEAEVRQRARKALAKPEGFQRDEAVIDVLQFIQRRTEPVRWWDTLFALWYANILSGWTTQAINVASTAANVMAEASAHMSANPRDAARLLTGLAEGGFRGMFDALAILKTGKVTGTRMEKLELPRVLERIRFTGGKLNPLNYAKYVSRVMAASDMVFFRSAEEMKGRILARRLAQEEGLTGRALSRRVYEILHNTPALREQARAKAVAEGFKPGTADYQRRYYEVIEQARPEELRGNAAEFGRTATFNQQPHGVLGLFANTLATLGRKLPPFKLIVPFTHVVSNVTNRALNFTPYGYKRLFWGHFVEKAEADRPDFGSEEWRVQFSRATQGTLLLSALGLTALQHLDDEDPPFMVYGKGPLDPRRGYQLRQAGWRPYSVKIGGKYYNYLGTPFHLGLALVGNYIDAFRYQGMGEKEVVARLAYAVKSAGQTVLDQSFLTGLKDFLLGLTQGGASNKDPLAGIGSRVARAAIPNLVKQIDAIFDPTIYTAEDLTTSLLRDIPVVRHHTDLKPMLNVLGEPIRRDRMERFVSPEINDPVWRMIADKQAWISTPSTTTKLGDRDMTPDELYEYVRLSGPRIRRRLESELSLLNRYSREEAQKRVASIVRQEREAIKDRLRSQMYR